MLVLSRRLDEKIKIGDTVITVVRISCGSVRLGIDAPPDVPILRDDAKKTIAAGEEDLTTPDSPL